VQAHTRNRIDDLFSALTNRYRRRLLVGLLQHDSQSDTLELPADVLTTDGPSEALSIELYHVHLPMLEERELIEWERETQTVSPGPAFEEIRPLLELMDEHRDELPDDWL